MLRMKHRQHGMKVHLYADAKAEKSLCGGVWRVLFASLVEVDPDTYTADGASCRLCIASWRKRRTALCGSMW
jgi:hypothetical protein